MVTSKLVISFFTDNGTPATGLSPLPTIDIWEVTPTGADTQVVTAASMTEVAGGFYKFNFTGYDEKKAFAVRSNGGTDISSIFDRFQATTNDSFEEDITCSIWGADVTLFTATSTFGGVVNLIRKIGTNRTRIDKIAKTLTLFDDNKTTPILVFDLKNAAGVSSIVEVCERDPC